jgi:hypothetical protein
MIQMTDVPPTAGWAVIRPQPVTAKRQILAVKIDKPLRLFLALE